MPRSWAWVVCGALVVAPRPLFPCFSFAQGFKRRRAEPPWLAFAECEAKAPQTPPPTTSTLAMVSKRRACSATPLAGGSGTTGGGSTSLALAGGWLG